MFEIFLLETQKEGKSKSTLKVYYKVVTLVSTNKNFFGLKAFRSKTITNNEKNLQTYAKFPLSPSQKHRAPRDQRLLLFLPRWSSP